MDVIWWFAKWSCLVLFLLVAFFAVYALLITGVFSFRDMLHRRRRRIEFSEQEAFRVADDGKLRIIDPGLEARLAAIGPFRTTVERGTREIWWESPAQLPCEFAPLELVFVLEPDNVGPDELTFALFESYKSHHDAHLNDFRSRLFDLHRAVEPELSNGSILSLIHSVRIRLTRKGVWRNRVPSARRVFSTGVG